MKFNDLSQLATLDPDLPWAIFQKRLAGFGYALGYEPEKNASHVTLRTILEERIPNRLALKYGEIDDLCVAVKVSKGRQVLFTKIVPRSATGPDFKKWFLGSGTHYGRIEEVTFQIIPLPEHEEDWRISLPNQDKKRDFLKYVAASGIRPCWIRATGRDGLKLSLRLEGPHDLVEAEQSALDGYY